MADYYGTIQGFKDYTTARLLVYDIDDTDSEIAAAMLVASDWIDGNFRGQFSGLKVGLRAQVREWPRTGATDALGYLIQPSEIPIEIQNATYEVTLRQLNGVALTVDYSSFKAYKSVSVEGAIAIEYASPVTSASDAQPVFIVVGNILEPLLSDGGSGAFSGLSGATSRV